MPLFISTREKQLWFWAFVVFVAIFFTLFLGQPLSRFFNNQDVRAAIFLLVMSLVGITILLHSLNTKPSSMELTIWIGLAAVYTMFMLRLGMPERSHLMAYSVLAFFMHKAIAERINQRKSISMSALFAFVLTFLIGVIDECIQIVLPNRIFDPEDIVFNGMAAAMAIGSSGLLTWVRKSRNKSQTHKKD